jgi:signal transduction histidine kinase/CheY-like chemotaxis protein
MPLNDLTLALVLGLIGLLLAMSAGILYRANRRLRASQAKAQDDVARVLAELSQAEADKAALEARNRQLQKAESLGRTAGSIAHHFNNQLQSVMASLDLMGGAPEPAGPERFVTMARQATEKAAEVSKSMLTYLGKTSLERKPLYLAELCRDSLALPALAQPSNMTLETELPTPGPICSVDADQFRLALTHLATNAWEAMAQTPGCLRLRLRTVGSAGIPPTHRFPLGWQPQRQDYACLEVEDTGIGISSLDIDKLFDPFFSTKFAGRGLGLAVVLGMAQGHGGAVQVASRPGQGSTFSIYLPIALEAVPSLPVGASGPLQAAGGTLLLVDDDELLLQATGAVIQKLGYTLLTAQNGPEAVDVYRRHQGDIRCVITDLTMPGMDGWATLAALRRVDPAIRVILASGYCQAQVMAGEHAELPQAFLWKPFDQQQLRTALAQALRQG